MSTPTIEQRVQAQAHAESKTYYVECPHLLTADELRRVLGELDDLRGALAIATRSADDQMFQKRAAERQRDQWRECARELVRAYNEGIIYEHSAALARFDALVKEEKIP